MSTKVSATTCGWRTLTATSRSSPCPPRRFNSCTASARGLLQASGRRLRSCHPCTAAARAAGVQGGWSDARRACACHGWWRGGLARRCLRRSAPRRSWQRSPPAPARRCVETLRDCAPCCAVARPARMRNLSALELAERLALISCKKDLDFRKRADTPHRHYIAEPAECQDDIRRKHVRPH